MSASWPMRTVRSARIAVALIALVSCTSLHTDSAPIAAGSTGAVPDTVHLGKRLRVEATSGASYVLTDAVVVHDSIVGRDTRTGARIGIALEDVRTVATHQVSVARTAGLVLGLAALTVLLAATAALASIGNIQ